MSKTVIRTEAAPAPFQGAPYNQAIAAGGLVFVALVAMQIVSIVGRKLFAWPVPGDVDVIEGIGVRGVRECRDQDEPDGEGERI